MLAITIHDDHLRVGRHVSISFQRTLRIPDDGGTYPLPPGLGRFPVCRVEDYLDRVPESWREHGGVFIPMYQREAMWLDFDAPGWRPSALKVGIGKVNAVSGGAWCEELHDPQDYVVVPDQPWLDGINAGDGFIRQFVAMPLGMGYTVEGQVTGEEGFGGIQLMVFEPKPGRFPEHGPARSQHVLYCLSSPEMGLGAGGRMTQKIYPDEHGIDTWDRENSGPVYVHIVDSLAYREITGREPPPTPVTARTYTESGLPWFGLYDEHRRDVAAAGGLVGVKSISEMDAEKGFAPQQDDSSVPVRSDQVALLGDKPVNDGSW